MPARDRGDLADRLLEQVDFLHASADAYDRGSRSEAVRLAVTLRTLLHDTSQTRSLLTQLGVLDDLRFLSTGSLSMLPGTGGELAGSALAPVVLHGDRSPEHFAQLHEANQVGRQLFHTWWNDPVLAAGGNMKWTRKDLVLALANQEGGAHVDPNPKQKWVDLKKVGVGFSTVDVVGDTIPLNNPAIPSVRQIAFEVEVTLHEDLLS